MTVTVVTLCGSTKFKEEFEREMKRLTLEANIVLSVGLFGHSGDEITEQQKTMLDALHKKKILLSDSILVINKGGYIGYSTRSEILFALEKGKKVELMEPMSIDDFLAALKSPPPPPSTLARIFAGIG